MASQPASPLPQMQPLESGRLTFVARPRVEGQPGVQRFLLVLHPDAGGSARRIHVGKKRLPRKAAREREWAYVDRVLARDADPLIDLGARVYVTKTRGMRHQPAAEVVADASYQIRAHGDHTHLAYDLEDPEARSKLCDQLVIRPHGDLIVAVFNPLRWARAPSVANDIEDGEEMPFAEPSIFDDALQAKFGERRFAPLEPAHLDVEGAELVLIDAGGDRSW